MNACYTWVCEPHISIECEVWVSVAVCSVLCLGDCGCLCICIWPAFVSGALWKCCWNPSTHRKTLPQPGQSGSILRATQPPCFPRAKSYPDVGFSEISQTVLETRLLVSGLDLGKLVNGRAGSREGTAGERLRREAEEKSRCLDRGRTGKEQGSSSSFPRAQREEAKESGVGCPHSGTL